MRGVRTRQLADRCLMETREFAIDRRRFLELGGYTAAAMAIPGKPGGREEGRPLNVRLIYHEAHRKHLAGTAHPEAPARAEAIIAALKKRFGARIPVLEPGSADDDVLRMCHDSGYLQVVRRDVAAGRPMLSTGDTAINEHSLVAAKHAAGGVVAAVDYVMGECNRRAFCVVRPPGHHASASRGMGFCVFNNIALGARHAQQKYGVGKVLIADWDVHHGNGTHAIFYEDPSIFFFDTHQHPWYPGTGSADETGSGKGKGTVMNCPFPAGSGRREIVGAFRDRLVPAADRFRPELVMVSAGFDSRQGDPLGGFHLTDGDFAELTGILLGIARRHAGGRMVSVLEGGYNVEGLKSASISHVGALADGGT